MSVGHFHIPGEATRRHYAVYVMIARHRHTGRMRYYVGKTGDNHTGCNPVISRAGNHFSFNKLHSQMRNLLEPESLEEYDFDYFYATFDQYVPPSESRHGVDLVNEMERQLNALAQQAFGEDLLNPYKGSRKLTKIEREKRAGLAADKRLSQLQLLIEKVIDSVRRGKAPEALGES